ncbi:MAG TPA: hypothetical protein VMV89_03775, partial [Candidatus Paceibacterota bacterium]|nr:hypothetical protein [Candidatus Paceibacterota bacterium]
DPRQRLLPLPPPQQKYEIMPRNWEPPPVSEPPPSKPRTQLWFYFYWPSTNATDGDGSIVAPEWPEKGPLHRFGYMVGEKGKPRSNRQARLTRFFELVDVPNLVTDEEKRDWGGACSGQRLKKMAYSIAAFCRNAKRTKRAFEKRRAIENWEDDLAWLKKQYYDDVFDFNWRST